MSETKKINLSLLPNSIDKALENVSDMPSRCIGETFADIWYLVLGGSIGYRAQARRIKYAAALEEYKKTVVEEIEKIPEADRAEGDIQIIGPILEASKYCAEKAELRKLFAKLIASTMNKRKENSAHPILTGILSQMTDKDAVVFRIISARAALPPDVPADEELVFSMVTLRQLGLIVMPDMGEEHGGFERVIWKSPSEQLFRIEDTGDFPSEKELINDLVKAFMRSDPEKALYNCKLTRIGRVLKEICID